MENIEIKPIEWGSDTYREELKLRNAVLRAPLGLDLFDEDLSRENADAHIGAFLSGKLVGVLVLSPLSAVRVKMRQVATEPGYQNHGIGKKLVAYAEEVARGRGYREMYLHSRKTAAGFYEKLDYAAVGEEFREVGIPHIAMLKKL